MPLASDDSEVSSITCV